MGVWFDEQAKEIIFTTVKNLNYNFIQHDYESVYNCCFILKDLLTNNIDEKKEFEFNNKKYTIEQLLTKATELLEDDTNDVKEDWLIMRILVRALMSELVRLGVWCRSSDPNDAMKKGFS
jgi:hypothetical protein